MDDTVTPRQVAKGSRCQRPRDQQGLQHHGGQTVPYERWRLAADPAVQVQVDFGR
jgi:hypothetical protein